MYFARRSPVAFEGTYVPFTANQSECGLVAPRDQGPLYPLPYHFIAFYFLFSGAVPGDFPV